jgi:uncharacterized membrane protein YhaH (DUF805 family)
MVKRFLAVFGLIMLFMAVLAVILLAVILIAGDNEGTILVAVLVIFVIGIGAFFPFLDWTVKRVFRFSGEGSPAPEAELRARIQALNQFDAPVMVEERKDRLVATWKYVDAQWWELLAKAGLTKIYELHMKFDVPSHTVTLIDITKSVSWRAGPREVRLRGGFFRGVILAYEIGKAWGIQRNFQPGKIYDYRFVPQEIKNPILNTILRAGWDVRFGIW